MSDVYKEGGLEKFRIKLVSGILKWLDPSANELMKLEDMGATGKLTVNTVSATNVAASAAAITGGTIDGTTNGATTPIVSEITKALYVRDDATLGPELITNGDMELDDASWPNWYTPTTNDRSDAVAPHGGSWSRRFVTNSQYDGIQTLIGPAGPGTRYKFSFWHYGTPGTTLSVRIYGTDTGEMTYSPAASWQQATYYANVTSVGMTQISFCNPNATTATYYIDDVSVKAVGGDARVDGALGVGGSAMFNAGQVTLKSAYPSASDRLIGTGTNAVVPVSRVVAQTSGDMADGFGPSIQFEATDPGAPNKVLGGIGAVRDGADTEGKVVVYAGTAGAEVAASFDHSLNTALAGDLDVDGSLTVSGTATFNSPIEVNYGADIIFQVAPMTGGFAAGKQGTKRGFVQLNHGAGGNTAGYILLYSRNGTAHYLWVEDDGTIKQSTTAPVDNADGNVVGAQT
jgi:hypothetical protein